MPEPHFSSKLSPAIGRIAGIAVLVIVTLIFVVCMVYRRKKNQERKGKLMPQRGNIAEMQVIEDKGSADSRNSTNSLTEEQTKFQGMDRIHNVEYLYKTKAYKKLKSLLEAGESAVVTGHAGMGKSATCAKLFKYFYTKKAYICDIMYKAGDLSLVVPRRNYILFLDGFFERLNYKNDDKEYYVRTVDQIVALYESTQSACIVIAIDIIPLKQYWDVFAKLPFFKNLIDLTSGEYALGFDERSGIIRMHLRKHNIRIMALPEEENLTQSKRRHSQAAISEKTIRDIINVSNSNIDYECGFPLACALFCRSKTFLKWKQKFFEKPLAKIKYHVEKLRLSKDPNHILQYMMYVYTVLRGEFRPRCIDFKIIESVSKKAFPDFSISMEQSEEMSELQTKKWIDACSSSSYLVEHSNAQYKFLHECIFLVVLRDFGTWQNDLLRKFCDNEDTLFKFEKACIPQDIGNSIAHNLKISDDATSIAKNLRTTWVDELIHNPPKRREKSSSAVDEEDSVQPLMTEAANLSNEDDEVN